MIQTLLGQWRKSIFPVTEKLLFFWTAQEGGRLLFGSGMALIKHNTFWCSHKNWFWLHCTGSWSQKTEFVHVQDLVPVTCTAPGTCSACMCIWREIFWKRVRERSLLSLLQVQVLRPGFVSILEPFFLCTLPNSPWCSCAPYIVFRVLGLLHMTWKLRGAPLQM